MRLSFDGVKYIIRVICNRSILITVRKRAIESTIFRVCEIELDKKENRKF
jgi:hypothetical protein